MTSVSVGADTRAGRSDAPAAGVGSIAQRVDRLPLTALHIGIVAIAACGFAFDLMEVALGNALSAVFSAPPYSVGATQLSLLLAAMYLGAIPGAILAGWFADRYGRKVVLLGVLLLLALTSTAAAASPDVNTLIVARTASGLALGAYPPLIISYLTDIMPARRRGMLIMIVSGLAAIGPVAIIFLVRWLTPIQPLGVEAWRWAFVLGAVGSLVVALAFRWLPETPRWLASKGRTVEAEAALSRFERSRALLASGPDMSAATSMTPASAGLSTDKLDKKRFALLGAIYFVGPWATVAFPLLMGAILIEKGFTLSDSLLYVGVTMFGPVVGTLLAAFFVDKVERRVALVAFTLGMIASIIAFATSLNPIWLMTAGAAFQILALLHVPTLTIYAAELFPTAYRARTSTAAWSINRIASAGAPLLLLPLLKTFGIWPMFSVMIVALVASVALVLIAPNGRAGRAVD